MNQALSYCNAVLTDYGVSVTLADDPQVTLTFDVENEGRMTYYGSLKEKALEYTLGALLVLGYKGRDCMDLLDGPDGGALAPGTKCTVAVGDNEYNGKITRRIRYINGLKRTVPADVKAKMLASGIAGTLASLRQGQPKTPSLATADDSDIEF